jgi:hypothetical protein
MISEKQIQAPRANGARSRGPVTAQGKRNSSRNNFRHGFATHDSSLDHNPPAAFTTLKAEYMADFQPATADEIHLVHTMAVARWRMFLVLEAEKRATLKAMARQNANSADPMKQRPFNLQNAPECHALLRYQVAFNVQFQRALARLVALNASRNRSCGSQIAKNAHAVRTQEELESKGTASGPLGFEIPLILGSQVPAIRSGRGK